MVISLQKNWSLVVRIFALGKQDYFVEEKLLLFLHYPVEKEHQKFYLEFYSTQKRKILISLNEHKISLFCRLFETAESQHTRPFVNT
jgi:hypothetical protein